MKIKNINLAERVTAAVVGLGIYKVYCLDIPPYITGKYITGENAPLIKETIADLSYKVAQMIDMQESINPEVIANFGYELAQVGSGLPIVALGIALAYKSTRGTYEYLIKRKPKRRELIRLELVMRS